MISNPRATKIALAGAVLTWLLLPGVLLFLWWWQFIEEPEPSLGILSYTPPSTAEIFLRALTRQAALAAGLGAILLPLLWARSPRGPGGVRVAAVFRGGVFAAALMTAMVGLEIVRWRFEVGGGVLPLGMMLQDLAFRSLIFGLAGFATAWWISATDAPHLSHPVFARRQAMPTVGLLIRAAVSAVAVAGIVLAAEILSPEFGATLGVTQASRNTLLDTAVHIATIVAAIMLVAKVRGGGRGFAFWGGGRAAAASVVYGLLVPLAWWLVETADHSPPLGQADPGYQLQWDAIQVIYAAVSVAPTLCLFTVVIAVWHDRAETVNE